MAPHAANRPWSCLPDDLIREIAKHLDSRTDLLRFRAVCRSWRSLLSPPNLRFPLIKLPFPVGLISRRILTNMTGNFYKLVESTIYCVQPISRPQKCWFIKVEETEEGLGYKVRLNHPISPLEFDSNLSAHLSEGLNLLDYRVTELTKVYGLRLEGIGLDIYDFEVKKVAVSSETDGAGFRFAVMAINYCDQLSIWRSGDGKWTPVVDDYCHDVVYHSGKFYAVDRTSMTISIDSSLKVTQVTPEMPTYSKSPYILIYSMRLVTSVEDLFLLVFYIEKFRVYKLNKEKGIWDAVRSLGDRVMFVGRDSTFSVSAQDFPGCKRNCIYFANSHRIDRSRYHAALFDVQEDCIKTLSSVYRYAGLFSWPPPAWVVASGH